jgi:hypothetical protein
LTKTTKAPEKPPLGQPTTTVLDAGAVKTEMDPFPLPTLIEAIISDVITTSRWLESTKVVGREVPFQKTVDEGWKLLPVTVKVTGSELLTMVVGKTVMTVGTGVTPRQVWPATKTPLHPVRASEPQKMIAATKRADVWRRGR